MKPPTLKELMANRKPYPYEKVANELNNLQDLSDIDKIIAIGEQESCNMVGIKKLYRMITNEAVKSRMKEIYEL